MTRPQVALVALLTVPVVAHAEQSSWYVVTGASEIAIKLGTEERTFDVGSGWSCTISPPSTFNARTTTCRKSRETVEFSVQCTAPRNEDHVQLRFRDGAGSRTFIEVGCRAGA